MEVKAVGSFEDKMRTAWAALLGGFKQVRLDLQSSPLTKNTYLQHDSRGAVVADNDPLDSLQRSARDPAPFSRGREWIESKLAFAQQGSMNRIELQNESLALPHGNDLTDPAGF
jgi:hypothetical protein